MLITPAMKDFPGWDNVSSHLKEIAGGMNFPYDQEIVGIEKQKVHKLDTLERRRRYLMRWVSLKGERTRQWDVWKELSETIMPELGRFLTSDHNKPKNTDRIMNNTATRMARSLSAGLLAGHTSPARPWLNLTIVDQQLAEWGPMRRWLFEVTRRVRLVYELSNFYRAMAMGVYPGLAVFGMGTCIAEEDPRRVMRFTPLAMGTYGIAGNGLGEVDTLQYEEAWTVGELVKEFGWDAVSPSVKVGWNGGWLDQYVAVLRTILPNEEFIPGAIGQRGKKFGSVWMEIGGVASASGALAQPSSDPAIGFLREGGYEEFPVLCARWATTSRDIYPTGPGHDALPDVRMLNQLTKRILLAINKGVNPAMLVPDALQQQYLSMLPGDAIYVPTGIGNVEIKPAHDVKPQWVEESRTEAQGAMQRIGQAFFAELMLMFSDDRPGEGKQPATAQEIAAKQEEKMLMLGPVLENINEFLTSLVERTIHIMARKGMLPPAPREAKDFRLKVEFVSTLAQAQKLVGVRAKERFIQFVGQVTQLVGPAAKDKVNTDKLIDRYADDVGVPPDCVPDNEEVQKVRAERAKQAQIQQQAQALMQGATAAKDAGKVPMDSDNLVTRMMGQPAGTMAGEGAQ